MININYLHIAYWNLASVIIAIYTVFAPEMFFHNTYKKENPELFDRWKQKRLLWNIHQSFMHFVGSLTGFLCLDILFFKLGVNDPSKFGLTHLILLLLGISGIMGLIPRILFGSTISK